jgi:hypothetical protein
MQLMFRLVAINSVGTSHPSRTIDLTTKEEMPEGPPTDVEATAASSQSLVITWKVGVNYTNILRASFLYKSLTSCFFVLAVQV